MKQLLLALSIVLGTASKASTLRTIALSGQPAPGAPPGVQFEGFGLPLINGSGQVAFTGSTSDPAHQFGIWITAPSGDPELVVLEGMPIPGGTGGAIFQSIGGEVLNDAGELAFAAAFGIWRSDGPSNLRPVAFEGDPAPGTSTDFVLLNLPHLDGAGRVIFQSYLAEPGGPGDLISSFWSADRAGTLSLLTRRGDPAPGTPSGVGFAEFGDISINDAGAKAFRANLQGAAVTSANDSGIWGLDETGSAFLIALEGSAAPGTPAGVHFGDLDPLGPFGSSAPFEGPHLNSMGEVAFITYLRGPGVTGPNDRAVFGPANDGHLTLLLREGDPALGTASGVVFSDFFEVVLNDQGQIAISASLIGPGVSGSNSRGVWSTNAAGGLVLRARAGDPVPGAPTGVRFLALFRPALTEQGDVLFVANLIDPAFRTGLLYITQEGESHLLVAEGLPLEVAPGDSRTVRSFDLYGGYAEDQGIRSVNDRDEVAFETLFTDDSRGVFVARVGVVLVETDIKPGSSENPINVFGRGVIPVALLGGQSFEVSDVDETTLAFGPSGASPVRGSVLEDVNGDGWLDLVSHYRTGDTGIAGGDDEACLTGETESGDTFEGCDAIRTVGRSCGLGFEVALGLRLLALSRSTTRRRRCWRGHASGLQRPLSVPNTV